MEQTPVSILSPHENDHLPAYLRQRDPDRVELMISCTDLADLDIFTKSDPMCVVFTRQFGQWMELGRTEAIIESLNPQFTESFVLDFDSEAHIPLLFTVYDIDSRSTDLKKHDQVGSVEVDLSGLVDPTKKITTCSHSLRYPGDPNSRGYIHITTELLRNSKSRICMHLGAIKLDKKGRFNMTKTDTYLEVCRSLGSDAQFHPIHRTELVFKNRDPRWRPMEISVQKLCNGDLDRPIQFSCWHEPSNHQRELIGSAVTSVRELHQYKGKGYNTLSLLEPKKARKKKYKHSGELKILSFQLNSVHTLLDFVRGGCCLKLSVAIDFTASNGDPNDPISLHNVKNISGNQYINAIKTVGGLLANYDNSHDIAAFGFGAKIRKRKKQISQDCFPLSLTSENVFTKGIKGLIETYQNTIPKLIFSGPSRISPVINEVLTHLSNDKSLTQDNQYYQVLMIITDGVINDLDKTIDTIIHAADFPMSIVLVGIGPADFTTLQEVFLPDMPLTSCSSKSQASRCNFHFVALRKQKYLTGTNASLARETLGVVSKQMVSYLKQKSIVPGRPTLVRGDPGLGGWVDNTSLSSLGPLGASLPTSPGSTLDQSLTRTPGVRRYNSVNDIGLSCPTCGALLEPSNDVMIDDPRSKLKDMI